MSKKTTKTKTAAKSKKAVAAVKTTVVTRKTTKPAAIEAKLPTTVVTDVPQTMPIPVDLPISATSDALKAYLNDLRNIPQLDTEQELELARKLHEEGDLQAAKILVSANLKTVVRIAYEYRSIYTNMMDLIQEGNIGLMKAVAKFDPSKGARLGYYASWWIRSYILKYILDNFRLVRVGTSQAQKKLFYHLVREQQKLEAQGIHAGPALLAEKIGVKEKDVVEMTQRLGSQGAEMSLETPVGGEDSNTHLGHTLIDTQERADERIEHQEWLQILEEHLPNFRKNLNDREKSILDDRILAEEPLTLQEVADKYALTRERVRQIETKLIEKLRDQLKDRMP